jgi:hypothetical protein
MVQPLRFSLAGLMGLVVVAGVGFAALRSASELWFSALLTLLLLALPASALGIILGRGGGRAASLGFLVLGTSYLLLAFCPGIAPDVRPHLLTSHLLDALFPRMHPEPDQQVLYASQSSDGDGRIILVNTSGTMTISSSSIRVIVQKRGSFLRTGHAIAAWGWALVGACIGRGIFAAAYRSAPRERGGRSLGEAGPASSEGF